MRLIASCSYLFGWPNTGNVCIVFQKEAREHTSSSNLLLMAEGHCSKGNCWTFHSFMHWPIQSSSDWAALLVLHRQEEGGGLSKSDIVPTSRSLYLMKEKYKPPAKKTFSSKYEAPKLWWILWRKLNKKWSDKELLGEKGGIFLQQVTSDPRHYFWSSNLGGECLVRKDRRAVVLRAAQTHMNQEGR